MIVNRRNFFSIIAGAIAAPALAKLTPPPPMLIGDGIADDTVAMNALMRGGVVELGPLLTGGGWIGDAMWLPTGVYRMTTPLTIGGFCSGKTIRGGEFMHNHGGPAIYVQADCKCATISDQKHVHCNRDWEMIG